MGRRRPRDGEPVAYPDEAFNRTDKADHAAALVSVQSVVVDPADRLWILDTGSPMFQPTKHGGPKLVCVDLSTDKVAKKILFPTDVALPTTYLNDVCFDLRRGEGGVAFITDSADKGPNGVIVVDLASRESWRRLHDHPSTKAEKAPAFLPVVEGRPFMERAPDGSTNPPSMGADGLESDADGRVYATSYEHNAVLRRSPGGEWETVAHDGRLLWPDTMSVAADGHLYVTATSSTAKPSTSAARICGASPACCSGSASVSGRSC